MAADEDSTPVTELQPIGGIATRLRSAGTPGRVNPNPVATSNTFGENDDESSANPSFPSETTITMVAEQDAKSPFDSTLTFVLHKLVGIDFTKDTTHRFVTVLLDQFVFSWEDFIDLSPRVILEMDENHALKDKFLAIQAFEKSHHTGDEEVGIPNHISYSRLLFRKFIQRKDFCKLAAIDAEYDATPQTTQKQTATIDMINAGDKGSPRPEIERSPPIDLVNTIRLVKVQLVQL